MRTGALHLIDDIIVPRGTTAGGSEPRFIRQRCTNQLSLEFRVGRGDHLAGKVGHDEIEIDGVKAVDDTQAFRCERAALGGRIIEGLPERRISRPPADIGSAFKEVADDQLYERLREIREPNALHLVNQRIGHAARQSNAAEHIAFEFGGNVGGDLRQSLYLVGDDGKSLAHLAGTRCFDQRIDRQKLDLLDDMSVVGAETLEIVADAVGYDLH
ncbi:hypothetical protein D3C73_679050 [compost metagenome]